MPLELVNSKVVKSTLAPGQNVLARTGSMLYYTGDVRFIPHSMGGGPAPCRTWAVSPGWPAA